MTWEPLVVYAYTFGLVVITVYSVFQLHLLALYYRWRAERRLRKGPPEVLSMQDPNLPLVTVQLPVFNERYVAERLIDRVVAMRWPRARLEIQVLDDSTDDTRDIVARRVAHWRERGVDIVQLCRDDRRGFKAGALAEATRVAKGGYLCIFDADFLPQPDFLLRAMARFGSPDVGVVQARWGHLNANRSAVTKVQAMLLDGFYLIEQPARAFAGFLLRFNGSAGVWRRRCIEEAGGWSGDTLSEDLDLAFRAQLAGWKVRYAYDVVAPAELPVSLNDFKEQQFRWTRGKAQVIRKLSGRILRSRRLSWMSKAHAFADLFNILVYPAALFCSTVSVVMAWLLYRQEGFPSYLIDTSFALLPLYVWIHFVVVILGHESRTLRSRVSSFARNFPAMLVVVLGITLYQTVAFVQGLVGGTGEFFRTPKFGEEGTSKVGYGSVRRTLIVALEWVMVAYFVSALVLDGRLGAAAFVPLHVSFLLGYAFVGLHGLAGLPRAVRSSYQRQVAEIDERA